MARINYGALTVAIRDFIAGLAEVRAAQATIEVSRVVAKVGTTPFIGVFEQRRTKTTGQSLAAGTRVRYSVQWKIVVAALSGKGFADAALQRDDLIGRIEVAFLNDRTAGGAFPNKGLELAGGELRSGPGDGGFIAEGDLDLSWEVEATTA